MIAPAEGDRPQAQKLPPWLRLGARGLLLVRTVLLMLLALVGGSPGRVLALCLAPRLLTWKARPEESWTRDLLRAALGGLGFLVACEVLLPALFTGAPGMSSDTAEHFWLLRSLEHAGWSGWSPNRYPLPALLTHLVAFGRHPFEAWILAARLSTFFVGTGLYVWGRALLGPGAGLLAVVLGLAFPELVLLARTSSSYPVLAAIWVLGSAAATWAVRHPTGWSCAAAGLGIAGILASDARGLLPGAACLVVTLVACLRLQGLWGRLRGLGLVTFLVLLSWTLQRLLPVRPLPLEALLETSMSVSHARVGIQGPERMMDVGQGYVWGRSTPLDLPATLRRIQRTEARMRGASSPDPELMLARERRMRPLLEASAPLTALACLGGGLRWRTGVCPRPDPTFWVGFLTLLPGCFMLASIWRHEYAERYIALAWPSLVVGTACGVATLVGRSRPPLVHLLVGLVLLLALPSPFALDASWRTPFVMPEELARCVGGSTEIETPTVDPLDNCLRAQATPLAYRVAWPWASPASDSPRGAQEAFGNPHRHDPATRPDDAFSR